MFGAPRSKEFDDVYFSAEDGLAESCHVFLAGNGLPEAWAGADEFTICETGFGTGLNFLAVWRLFEDTAAPHQTLHFISFEKYPLSAQEVEEALQPFAHEFERQMPIYLQDYMGVQTPRVKLTLILGDVNAELPKLDACVDAWFLDGFKPSSNPDMWSEIVFNNMARLSHEGTTLATFTSAGFVRRGLQAAGFEIEKTRGYGRKREMVVGVFKGRTI